MFWSAQKAGDYSKNKYRALGPIVHGFNLFFDLFVRKFKLKNEIKNEN